jgi:hypothetical protein
MNSRLPSEIRITFTDSGALAHQSPARLSVGRFNSREDKPANPRPHVVMTIEEKQLA